MSAHDHVHGLRIDEHLAAGLIVANMQTVIVDAHDPLKIHLRQGSIRCVLCMGGIQLSLVGDL